MRKLFSVLAFVTAALWGHSESLAEGSRSLYVWRGPARHGTPVTLAEAHRLADFAVAEGIRTIHYDNFGCGENPGCPEGAGNQSNAELASIIRILHSHGLRVEALYTDVTRLADLVQYNQSGRLNERFDGVRLNIEPEPASCDDLSDYREAVNQVKPLPVFASIGHHWGTDEDMGEIPFSCEGGSEKEAFKHIMDIVAGVDVQAAQDGLQEARTVIERLTKEEVCYGNLIGKPVTITLETQNPSFVGLSDFNTFFEEGEAAMKEQLADIDFSAPNVGPLPCDEPMLTGFTFHFYRQSYGSSTLEGWETNIEPRRLLFPQLALGGGFRVVLFAANQSQTDWSGTVELDGGGWPVDRLWFLDGTNRTGESAFDLNLAPNETRKFLLTADEALNSGWLEIQGSPTDSIEELATALFYNLFVGEQLIDSTGVPPTSLVHAVRFPAERSQNVNTGLAIRRAENSLRLSLFDQGGMLLETWDQVFDGAKFIDEVFTNVPAEFVGSVQVESETPFYLTVLRQELVTLQLTAIPATPVP